MILNNKINYNIVGRHLHHMIILIIKLFIILSIVIVVFHKKEKNKYFIYYITVFISKIEIKRYSNRSNHCITIIKSTINM